MKKLGILIALFCICFAVMPVTANAKPKTVKIHSFSSGDKKVDKKIRSIIKKKIKPGMSTAEKIKTVHDYMVLTCKYDYTNYSNGTIPKVSYTPRGVLIKKKAVCQGYAETFQLFMDALGIPCKTVTGTANNGSGNGYQGHAWNMVKVNNKWYHVDVTWDDPVPDQKKYINYGYFLIPDSQMDNDHKWNRSSYPKCKSSSNKFIKLFGKVSKTMDSATDALYNGYQKDKNKTVTIIIPKKLYKSYKNKADFNFELMINVARRHCVSITAWNSSKPYAYGNYYIMRFTVTKAEAATQSICPHCEQYHNPYLDICPHCGKNQNTFPDPEE